jgi:hypothetical protein
MVDQHRAVHVCACRTCSRGMDPEVAQYHAAINAVLPELHERSRRLFAGLLASEHGHGGTVLLGRITGLSRTTILRGQRELRAGIPLDGPRIRRPGGGRPCAEKKVPVC